MEKLRVTLEMKSILMKLAEKVWNDDLSDKFETGSCCIIDKKAC